MSRVVHRHSDLHLHLLVTCMCATFVRTMVKIAGAPAVPALALQLYLRPFRRNNVSATMHIFCAMQCQSIGCGEHIRAYTKKNFKISYQYV